MNRIQELTNFAKKRKKQVHQLTDAERILCLYGGAWGVPIRRHGPKPVLTSTNNEFAPAWEQEKK